MFCTQKTQKIVAIVINKITEVLPNYNLMFCENSFLSSSIDISYI